METTITLTPMQFRNAIVHAAFCMGQDSFRKCWGVHMGDHLWSKFEVKRNWANLVGELDLGNLSKLLRYLDGQKGKAV
jgi:hypothetical protein